MAEIKNYKPGLALLLVEKQQYSFLNGLGKKYPLAWEKRAEYPYHEAKVFSSSTVEREYYSKLAYALWEYADENQSLEKELALKVMSFFPKYKRSRGNFIHDEKFVLDDYCAGFIISELMGILSCVNAQNDLYTLIILSVGLFFAKQEGMPFINKSGDFIERTSSHFFESSIAVKRLASGGNTLTTDEMKDAKNVIKNATKGIITAYNNKIGGNVYKELPELLNILKPNMLEHDAKTAIYHEVSQWFNQDLFLLVKEYKLTNQDVENIFYNIIKSWTHEEVDWMNASNISESVLNEVDMLLVYTAITYIFMKATDASSEFYWKEFKAEGSNDTIITALKLELEKTKNEKEQYQSMIQKHSQELQECRLKREQMVSTAIKDVKDELNATKRENRLKEQEIEELRRYVKELEQELLEVDEQLETMQIPVSDVPMEELIEKLNKPNILISPGHQNLVNKMKEILPNAKFYELDRSYQNNFFNGVTHVFINKKYFNHGKYYKVKMALPDAKIYRITRTKLDLVLNEMVNAMGL